MSKMNFDMIKVIDLKFLGHPEAIAAFLLETANGPVLFETGPYATFGQLEQGLARHGYEPGDVKHVFITHIHLDHAGAAWALAQSGATIYMHPFGAAHMHDPSKLMASAARIYGDDMERLWSDMKGIPMEQIRAMEHEEAIEIGGQLIKSWHTPGHAVHHIAWQVADSLIAGDVAGVAIAGGPVVPPCPPPDINIEDWKASIQLMRSLPLAQVYLTHFGRIAGPALPAHLDELEKELDVWAAWIKPEFDQQHDPASITPRFQAFVAARLKGKGVSGELLEVYESANPSWMSVAGLLRYWKKKAASGL